jgi:hypothetical protein
MGTAIFAVVLVAIVAGIGWMIWDNYSRSFVLRFEGQRIHTNELRFLMVDESPEGIEAGMEALIEYLTILHRADQHGFGLTDEEREMWEWIILSQFGEVPFITPARFGEFISVAPGPDGMIWERLMNYYIPEFLVVLDEEQLAIDLAAYKAANLTNYLETESKFLLIEEYEEAAAAYAQLLAGELDFDAAIRLYDPWYDEESGIIEVPLGSLISWAGLDAAQTAAVMALQTGEMSELIFLDEEGFQSHLIIYIESREEIDEAAIEVSFRQQTILHERNRMLSDLVPQWIRQANYSRNNRAINLVG